jgi:SAM-dependent methyltransferase
MSEDGRENRHDPIRWADPAPTYDRVAPAYADRFLDELDHKPFDRELLARFATDIGPGSSTDLPLCDLGCGPGQIGRFLFEHGVHVMGIDLSAGMVAQARLHHPSMEFAQGDMNDLRLLSDGSLAGIVCFYALIHIPRPHAPAVLREMRRVLAKGGALLVAVHGGEGTLHADQMAGLPADLDATLFSLAELTEMIESAGYAVSEAHERDPYPDEHPTQRLYVRASLPG